MLRAFDTGGPSARGASVGRRRPSLWARSTRRSLAELPLPSITPYEVRYAVPDPTRTDRWTTHQRGAPARDARPPATITPHQVRTRADPGSSSTLVRRFWATRSRSVGSAEEASTSNDPSEGGPPCNIRAAFWTVEAVTHMYLNTHDRMLTDRQRLRCGKVSRLLFRCSIGCPSRRFSDRSPRAVATEDLSTPRFRDGERRRRFHGRSRGSRRRSRRLSRVRFPRTARGFAVFHRSDWRDGCRRRPAGPRRG